MSSKQLVTAYISIQERLKDQRRVLSELRDQEKQLQKELTDYLNQTEEEGIRLDEDTVITLEQTSKKISRGKKAYREYLIELCAEKGIPDDVFVESILSGKIDTTVQQSKIKLIKSKKSKRS